MSVTTAPQTGLYVPGDRPDRFDKAVATGAELVIVDLEDAVAPEHKATARHDVESWLRARDPTGATFVVQVRVNEGDDDDLRMLARVLEAGSVGADAAGGAAFEVRLPKVESAEAIDHVARTLPGVPVTALIESALGVERAMTVAAHPAVTRLALGESDLASELGTRDAAVLDHARIRLLFAARANGLDAPMLSAYPAVRDLDGLRDDTRRGRAIGYRGRVAIHPSQLAVIREVFAPSPGEHAWAEAVVAALEASAGGATTLPDGEMVDAAMLGRAHDILGRGRSGRASG